MNCIEEIDITYGGAIGAVGYHKVSLINGESLDLSGSKKLSVFIWYKEGKSGIKKISIGKINESNESIKITKALNGQTNDDSIYLSYTKGENGDENLITALILTFDKDLGICSFNFQKPQDI